MAVVSEGVCPACDARGVVGAPCGASACQRDGVHFIPATDARAVASPRDPTIGTLIGNYLVVGVVGAGGFGKVYLALQQPIGMRTALKIIRREALPAASDGGPDPIARFELEAKALARLSHPNIVRLLHYDRHHGSPYMVMELVANASTLKSEIAARAASHGQLKVGEIRSILGQLLAGLGAAHDVGLIHRDIKPENLMLQPARGDSRDPWHLKIIDFGLAKDLAEGDQTLYALGTVAYMAPEQIRRRELGPWTDLYAVGAIAFELMTGRRVFRGEVSAIVSQKLDPTFEPISAASADLVISAPVEAFLRRALAADPGARFRDVAAFRTAMDAALAALEGVDAGIDVTRLADDPPTNIPRRRSARRHQRLVRLGAAAALGTAALAALIVGASPTAPGDGAGGATRPTPPPPAPVVAGMPAAPDADAALIVSIEDYAYLPRVTGADANGRAWLEWFTRTRQIRSERVKWLRNAEGTPSQIKRAAAQMADAVSPGGTLWVVFIGHGAPSLDQSDGVLVGVSAQQAVDEFYAQSLSQSELMASLAAGRQAHNVVLVDACFSGRAPDGTLLAVGVQPALLNEQPQRLPGATTLLTAGTSREFAGALPGAARPAFSYLALTALAGAGDTPPQGNGDGAVTGAEVIAFARTTLVAALSGRSQTPQAYGDTTRALVAHVEKTPAGAGPGVDLAASLVEASRVAAPPQAVVDASRGASGAAPLAGAGLLDAMEAGARKQDPAGVSPAAPKGVEPLDLGVDLAELKRSEATWAAILDTQEVPLVDTVAGAKRRAAAWDKVATLAAKEAPATGAKVAQYAQKEAKRWREVAAALPQMHADWSKCRELLALAVASPATKRDAIEKFIAAYTWLAGEWELAEARTALDALARGDGQPVGAAGAVALSAPEGHVRIAPDATTPAFWLKGTATTLGEWQALMGEMPLARAACGSRCPVTNVTWFAAAAYLDALSLKAGLEICYMLRDCVLSAPQGTLTCQRVAARGSSCRGFRLPSDAERELAARAPAASPYTGAAEWLEDTETARTPRAPGSRADGIGFRSALSIR